MKPLRVAFICVLPSPYQRDLLAALAARPEVELSAFYMEKAAPDSPWPEKPLASYEQYLPGFWFGLGTRRVHANWPLPDLRSFDFVVLNTLMSLTGQYLMRVRLRGQRWLFWGEKLGHRVEAGFSCKATIHQWLTSALHRAAGIVGIGRWATENYRARYPAPRHFDIPYHCDLTPFLEQPRPTNGETVTFLFAGQMIARKGLDLLLEAFAGLPARARLLLVGREADLPTLLAALPEEVRSRIEYAGFQAPDALPPFFARTDVFVLPSRYDGWGVVVNQALGAGLPIICSDQVGAGYDLVAEGENGHIFPVGNVQKLRSAMQHFLDEPSTIAQYGEASRARAAEWQPAAGAARWVAALQSLLS
jgi:glycosyltransferase involved in cell wall biosynthesis